MLFGTDNEGSTVWHLAAMGGHIELLQKLWDWAKENLTVEKINNKLLLGTDNKGWTAWQWAAEGGHFETLQMLWE